MNLQTVLIVSHDAGGANLLAHWCKNWQNRINFIYKVAGPALKIFKSLNLEKTYIVQYPNPDLVDAVVTSTGWQSNIEYEAIQWAKQHDIRSASYLDHWVNYPDRFIREDISLCPDEIWAGDRDALNLAEKVFVSKNIKLRFMRNQYFCTLKRKVETHISKADSILICLEPIRNGISYTEVYARLAQYLSNSNYRASKVVIRDHPSGTDTGLEILMDLLTPKFKVTISQQELWQDLACSCAVVGYQSAVLAYACYLNIAAISYFPVDKLEPILPHKSIKYFKNNMTIL